MFLDQTRKILQISMVLVPHECIMKHENVCEGDLTKPTKLIAFFL